MQVAPKRLREICSSAVYSENVKWKRKMTEIYTNDSVGSIFSLNDDCFLEILSHLDTIDLCAFRECCQRFWYLATSALEKRCKRDEYLYLFKKGRSWRNENTLVQTAALFTDFGKYMTRLCINDDGRSKIRRCAKMEGGWSIDETVGNCTALKFLRLSGVKFSELLFDKLMPTFRNIETLEMDGCESTCGDIVSFLKNATKLKCLEIDSPFDPFRYDYFWAIGRFGEHLETIRFKRNCKYKVSACTFFRLVRDLCGFKNLKNLEICNIRRVSIIIPMMQILQLSESLETLCLSRFQPNEIFFKALRKLSFLKECTVHTRTGLSDALKRSANDFDITEVMDPNVPIKKCPYTIRIAVKK